jgi:cytochrome bd-type quinol oxidase subunit 1
MVETEEVEIMSLRAGARWVIKVLLTSLLAAFIVELANYLNLLGRQPNFVEQVLIYAVAFVIASILIFFALQQKIVVVQAPKERGR